MMRAAVLSDGLDIEIVEAPTPKPEPGSVLISVRAAGVCGTEVHFLEGLLDPGGTPRILGHEIAGVVSDGDGTLPPGTRVVVYNVLNCGECHYCTTNRDRLCDRSNGMLGFNVDGGFAEYVAVPEANLIPLPLAVDLEAGAVLACSGMTAVHAVRRSGAGLGDSVVVNGVGGVGLMVVQVAALTGASVVAVGDHREKLDIAAELGASTTVLLDNDDDYPHLRSVVRREAHRPTVFFETVGTADSMQAGIDLLAPGGTFVQIGYTRDRFDFHPSALIKNELSLVTSAAGSKADLETAVALAESGKLSVKTTARPGLESLIPSLDAIRAREVLGRNVIVLDSPNDGDINVEPHEV